MRLRQQVCFTIRSDSLAPDELTSRIGIEPDHVRYRGSRHPGPKPVPRHHIWEICCDEHNMTLGAQIESVMNRIIPVKAAVRQVVADHDDITASLSAGRFFGDDEGDLPTLIRGEDGKVLDRESLFGWYMSADAIRCLAYVGADLDIDEYDLRDDEDLELDEPSASPS